MIKLELKIGNSSLIFSAEAQDLKDLKSEIKRFTELVVEKGMENPEHFLQWLFDSKLFQTDTPNEVPPIS